MEADIAGRTSESQQRRKYKIHWHVVLVHFPVSALAGAFLFMALHLITKNPCLDYAAFITLLVSAIVLIPVTLSGWFTWKYRYGASKIKLFRIKIWTAVAMIPLSLALVVYHALYPFDVLDAAHVLPHALYFAGVTLLMAGAFVEGFWGGRLNHR
ncbi:MAG: hypothetical protein Q7W51_08815 [Coriobacteriia bacterium]|nr:hypothetical protein [Coriobacteriia bacterium]